MYKNSKLLKLISMVLIVLMVSTPMMLLAQEEQEDTFFQGKLDGERDAKGNGLWALAGCACGIFGVAAAYLIKPTPPAAALIGRSSEYIMGYTEGYQNKSRNKNAMYACGGWAAFVLIYAAAGGFNTSD